MQGTLYSDNYKSTHVYPVFDPRSILYPGLKGTISKLISERDTCAAHGFGALGNLIATPVFISQMIKASVNAVDNLLPTGLVTVGRGINLTHEAPTMVGMTLKVIATLKEINGHKLLFEIVAFDDFGEVGRGTHERIVVQRDRLFRHAEERLCKFSSPH